MPTMLRRFGGWWFLSAVLVVFVAIVARQQLDVLLYKTLQVTMGVVIGYWADAALFAHVGPMKGISHDVFGAARILARALVVLGVLHALAVGL